ncbi:MAG TPA: hypothetical protein VF174_15680 [Micromonosporaceae bacterium]
MKITPLERSSTVTVERRYSVTGVEPVQKLYGKRTFAPDAIAIVWVNGEIQHVNISGYVVVKGGAPSPAGVRVGNSYYSLNDAPEWLRDFAVAERPEPTQEDTP